ncbi:hypothetical protein ACET3Z_004238 [Daucus carota]
MSAGRNDSVEETGRERDCAGENISLRSYPSEVLVGIGDEKDIIVLDCWCISTRNKGSLDPFQKKSLPSYILRGSDHRKIRE